MKKTKDYEMFGKILGNRELHEGHLKKLEESILSNNLLYANPIIIDRNHDIVDGQHRLEVAKKNNLDIYYLEVPDNEALRVVRQLNTNMRGWSLMNFVDSNIALGNSDYQIVKDFAENYNLAISTAKDLLQGASPTNGGSHNMHAFKEGNFKVKGLKRAMKLAEALNLSKPYVGKVYKDRAFLKALQMAFEKVGTQKVLKKLERSPLKVQRQVGWKEYLRNLEDIYNWHSHNPVRFF